MCVCIFLILYFTNVHGLASYFEFNKNCPLNIKKERAEQIYFTKIVKDFILTLHFIEYYPLFIIKKVKINKITIIQKF